LPFYFRKSVSAGPFRFNFSKGGVGVSVGVKGFRVGTGPRGHYVHAGRGGFYYRASLGAAGGKQAPSAPKLRDVPTQPLGDSWAASPVEMVEVESAEVLEMRDEKFAELLDEINAKQQQFKVSSIAGWGAAGLIALGLLSGLSAMVMLAVVLGIPAYLFGRWWDSYRRSTVLFYDFEPDVQAAYESLTRAFDTLCGCAATWHVEAGGAVRDLTTWKRNAGASHIVRKKPTLLGYKLPTVVKSNITPPAMHVGKQTIYFLPDVALVEDGARFGAVGYQTLQVAWQDSNFIEEGSVPRDAQVIFHTWKHPNKNGGPDRRFANNYQIPVCRYEAMHLSSGSGLNELVEFSKTGVSPPFASALRAMPHHAEATAAPRLVAATI